MNDIDMRVFARNAGVNVTFPAGSIVFSRGDDGSCMYVVQSGVIEMMIGDTVVDICGPNEALGFMSMGGRGCISVTANVAPRLCADFQDACLRGDWARALELQDRLFPLHVAMFSDASPGPAKYALNRLRPDMPTDVRLPLTPPGDASRRAVDAALEHAGLV